MNARLLNFSVCSLCLHAAVSWLFVHAGAFERGIADIDRVLAVNLIAGEGPRHTVVAPSAAGIMQISEAPSPADEAPATQAGATPATPEAAASEGYAAAGRLTKLPAPLSDIDLNVPEISEFSFRGEARLTVLIDADGSVVDVTNLEELPGLDEFAELVAARFRSARFTPGEIDGRPVKSQLQITVVSEIPATGNLH